MPKPFNSVENILPEVIAIARRAGDIIMGIYDDPDVWNVEFKSDDSPLTIADKKSNDVIIEGLQLIETETPIISEETKLKPYTERQSYDWYWMVDPLDGTKEFIKRNGEFTVNIALCEGESVVLGVVYVPASQDLYYAAKGYGAYKGEWDEKIRLRAPSFSMSEEGLIVVTSRSHLNEDTMNFMNDLTNPQTLATGSSLKFMKIAEGSAHLYPRLGPTMEWDTAAAQIILEEAGGHVMKWQGDHPLKYNKEDLLNPYFIATGAMKHA